MKVRGVNQLFAYTEKAESDENILVFVRDDRSRHYATLLKLDIQLSSASLSLPSWFSLLRLLLLLTSESPPLSQSSYPLPPHREGPDEYISPPPVPTGGGFFLPSLGLAEEGTSTTCPMNLIVIRPNGSFHDDFLAQPPTPTRSPFSGFDFEAQDCATPENDFLVQNHRPDLVTWKNPEPGLWPIDFP